MPLRFTATDTVVAGLTVPWYCRFAMALIPTAIAYTLGFIGVPSWARVASLFGCPRCCSR